MAKQTTLTADMKLNYPASSAGRDKGLLDPDQAEGLRNLAERENAGEGVNRHSAPPASFQADVCRECRDNEYDTRTAPGAIGMPPQDIARNIAHDMVTLADMLNPERIHDAGYLRRVSDWAAILREDIARLTETTTH